MVFDEIAQLVDSVAEPSRRIDIDHAVARNVLARYALDGQHGTLHAKEHVDQLPRRRYCRIDHIVAQDDGERLVADEIACDEHRMAEAERLALPHVGKVDHVRDLADLVELLSPASRLEKRFQLNRDSLQPRSCRSRSRE